MEFGSATLWWVIAGVLVAAEMATGTFYLLMLVIGVVAAALVAHAGLGAVAQLTVGSVIGVAAVVGWYLRRRQQPGTPPARSNPDLNLDIGSAVRVERWDADGRAQVSYRGATWSARYGGSGVPVAGMHVIRAIDGSVLELGPAGS